MSEHTDLRNVVDGAIEIKVAESALRFAAENHPQLWDGSASTKPVVVITDMAQFTSEVVRAINREAEDGSSPLTRMLDAAILYAVEEGCEGVDHEAAE